LSKIAWTVRSSARVPSAASASGAATLPLLGSAMRADKLHALDALSHRRTRHGRGCGER
jgi:hypothetical protein